MKWEGLNSLLIATILHPLIDFLSLLPLNFLLAFHASSLSLVHLRLISLCHLEFVHIPYNNNLSRSLWAAHCHATMSSACPNVWRSLLCPYMAYVGICDAALPSLFPILEGLHFGAYSTQHRVVRDASLLNHSTSHPHIVYHPHCAAFSPHTTLGGREGYCYAAWVLPTALHGWETSLYLFLTQHLCEAIPLCCTPIPGYPTQSWRVHRWCSAVPFMQHQEAKGCHWSSTGSRRTAWWWWSWWRCRRGSQGAPEAAPQSCWCGSDSLVPALLRHPHGSTPAWTLWGEQCLRGMWPWGYTAVLHVSLYSGKI